MNSLAEHLFKTRYDLMEFNDLLGDDADGFVESYNSVSRRKGR